MSTLVNDISRGILKENPVFRLLLGMCPVLGVTVAVDNGLGMGVAATIVLLCANVVISMVRSFIPKSVRIPCFIVVIATFVTMVDMVLEAFVPPVHDELGIFVPLIVVNCMILGRAEAFASKQPVLRSLLDGIGVGIGFTIALVLLSAVREILGDGTISYFVGELNVMGSGFDPMGVMTLPPGAFIALGVLLVLVNAFFRKFKIE